MPGAKTCRYLAGVNVVQERESNSCPAAPIVSEGRSENFSFGGCSQTQTRGRGLVKGRKPALRCDDQYTSRPARSVLAPFGPTTRIRSAGVVVKIKLVEIYGYFRLSKQFTEPPYSPGVVRAFVTIADKDVWWHVTGQFLPMSSNPRPGPYRRGRECSRVASAGGWLVRRGTRGSARNS
jgi:hypothetical protein